MLLLLQEFGDYRIYLEVWVSLGQIDTLLFEFSENHLSFYFDGGFSSLKNVKSLNLWMVAWKSSEATAGLWPGWTCVYVWT